MGRKRDHKAPTGDAVIFENRSQQWRASDALSTIERAGLALAVAKQRAGRSWFDQPAEKKLGGCASVADAFGLRARALEAELQHIQYILRVLHKLDDWSGSDARVLSACVGTGVVSLAAEKMRRLRAAEQSGLGDAALSDYEREAEWNLSQIPAGSWRPNAATALSTLEDLVQARTYLLSESDLDRALVARPPTMNFDVRLPNRTVIVLFERTRDDLVDLPEAFPEVAVKTYGIMFYGSEEYEPLSDWTAFQSVSSSKIAIAASNTPLGPGLYPDNFPIDPLRENLLAMLSEGRWLGRVDDPTYTETSVGSLPPSLSSDVGLVSFGIPKGSSKGEKQLADEASHDYEVGLTRQRYRIKNRSHHEDLSAIEREQGWHYEWRTRDPYVVGDPEKAVEKANVKRIANGSRLGTSPPSAAGLEL